MASDVEFAVVGAGMAGAATARALARAGREVVLLEQFEIGHKRGSSHGESRIFRFSYPDPRYVRMAIDALALWRELEDEIGRELVTPIGGLDAGKPLDDHASALASCGVDFSFLDGREVMERFPALSLAADATALFQPDAGIVRADTSVRALVDSAVAHGALLREMSEVARLAPRPDAVEIETAAETYRARVAVVTAGAWARSLLAPAGIELPVTPTRETVAYFPLDGGMSVPSLVDWVEPPFYALTSPGHGIKSGLHHTGPETDPRAEGEVDLARVERIAARVTERFPDADPQPRHVETCLYTNTADEDFVVQRWGNIVVGSACSGHGFKFAPVTGRRLARLALGVAA
jgi:sarcosine oxidase